MENSLVSVSMLSDVTQDNDLNLVDNIAPVRGVSNKTAQILASLNLNASVGQSRPGLSVGLGRLPTNEGQRPWTRSWQHPRPPRQRGSQEGNTLH